MKTADEKYESGLIIAMRIANAKLAIVQAKIGALAAHVVARLDA